LAAAFHSAKSAPARSGDGLNVDYGKLSDAEFNLKKAEVFAAAEAGQLR